jgi:hypothetical protein
MYVELHAADQIIGGDRPVNYDLMIERKWQLMIVDLRIPMIRRTLTEHVQVTLKSYQFVQETD